MQIVILTLPAYGHINPTLRLSSELVEREHDVTYYLPEQFEDVVEPTGAASERLGDEFDMIKQMREHDVQLGSERGPNAGSDGTDADRTHRPMFASLVSGSIDAAPDVADRVVASDPDVIVYDPLCLWGRVVVDRFRGPSIAFYTSFVLREESPLLDDLSFTPPGTGPGVGANVNVDRESDPESNVKRNGSLPEPLVAFFEERGVSDPGMVDFLAADADRSIVPIPRAFQSDHDAFGEDYVFVGPMIRAGDEQQDAGLPYARLANRRSVYVSLGTLVHGDTAFFAACFDAFADTDWELVVTSKADADRLDDESPENVSVRSRVPQLDLLEQVDVFVTHGGMNSTMEALSFGTPLVVVPQVGDQYAVAERVTELGLGTAIDTETLTADALFTAVNAVHGEHHEAIEAFQTTMREAGGATRAATAIESFVETTTID